MTAETNTQCTWCKGAGTVTSARTVRELAIMEWILVVGAFALIVGSIHMLGQSYGLTVAVLVAGLVLGLPFLQMLLWIAGGFGLFNTKKPCRYNLKISCP